MAKPNTPYAIDEDGQKLMWPSEPPMDWTWCSHRDDRGQRHHKPDDGEPCPYCGTPQKRGA